MSNAPALSSGWPSQTGSYWMTLLITISITNFRFSIINTQAGPEVTYLAICLRYRECTIFHET
ncbi:hypothetical protein GALMADRAFT_223159 [Galerina marginata CBS 339.88]|uniref:Uncharacterized protein n=1 Tax=Galerina marginata (strain CBS 339.88) TaxID=685588 RepID=A0A067TK16_GALM3|nr:hypothetical protein GALMADRAFT_223159 [Galerina marginata CBS 339.88]